MQFTPRLLESLLELSSSVTREEAAKLINLILHAHLASHRRGRRGCRRADHHSELITTRIHTRQGSTRRGSDRARLSVRIPFTRRRADSHVGAEQLPGGGKVQGRQRRRNLLPEPRREAAALGEVICVACEESRPRLLHDERRTERVRWFEGADDETHHQELQPLLALVPGSRHSAGRAPSVGWGQQVFGTGYGHWV